MSLKTKLVAVILGLNGAILLIALGLYLLGEAGTPNAAVDRILHAVHGQPDPRDAARIIAAEQAAGRVGSAWVVRDAGSREEFLPPEFWTLGAYLRELDEHGLQPDVSDPRLREQLARWLGPARTQLPAFVLRDDHLAVHVPESSSSLRHHAFVVELHNPRRGVRTVYWVLVGGIVVVGVGAFLLVQRVVVAPLARLARTADRIAQGDYRVERVDERAPDEIGRTLAALEYMAGEIAEYQGHLEDRVLSALTRIKKAEHHLAIAQRLASTGKLASGLAHEINNPLGGMKNAVRSLLRGDLGADKTRLYLGLIDDGLARIEQTVKKFLSFTPRRVDPHPVDLADVARKSIALAEHRIERLGIQIESSLPEAGSAIVFGDGHELQQVALNLLLNAADAIPSERSDGRVRVEVAADGEDFVLRVTDNGTGMTREAQDHCFDMFFTTKAEGEGSGMGLAVVHNIVTNHGGRIELESRLGVGTTFQVVLPGELPGARQRPGAPPGPEPFAVAEPGEPPHDR